MNKEDIFAILILIGLAGFIILSTHKSFQKPPASPETPEKAQTESWLAYEDKNIGIQFQYPAELKPFPPKEMYFGECDSCPSAIYVKSEVVGAGTVEDILKLPQFKNIRIVSKTIIDGLPAIIASPGTETDPTNQKIIYFVKDGTLYTISARWTDLERFWKTIKLI